MPATPISHPLMTSPLPSLKLNGLPDLFAEDDISINCGSNSTIYLPSKTLPSFNLPMYLISTVFPFLATGPFPVFLSSILTPCTILTPSFAFAVAVSPLSVDCEELGGASRSFANCTFLSLAFVSFISSAAVSAGLPSFFLSFFNCFLLSFGSAVAGSGFKDLAMISSRLAGSSSESSAGRLFLPFLAGSSFLTICSFFTSFGASVSSSEPTSEILGSSRSSRSSLASSSSSSSSGSRS